MKFPLRVTLFVLAVICTPRAGAQSPDTVLRNVPGGHRGAVTALLRDAEGRILSAGKDGFLEIWNERAAEDRFQISPHAIESMVLRPGKPEITIIENNGLGLYRVSAWDYKTRKNLFILRFRDPVSYINYSASGGFLIAARSGRTGAVFVNSETGELLEFPASAGASGTLPEGGQASPFGEFSGSIGFAATSRSEKTIISYQTSGVLSYWNLETGEELQHFEVPPNIQSPLLFGNSRFLGGFDSRGLLILDAVTGSVLARDDTIKNGRIFIEKPDSSQFYCLSSGGNHTVLRMEIDLSGRLTVLNRRNVPAAMDVSCCAAGDGDNVILGTEQGSLMLLSRGGARVMDTGNPVRIIDTAVSPRVLAFVSDGSAGYIPLDYTLLENNATLFLEDAGTYTGVISEPARSNPSGYNPAGVNNGESRFLFWQKNGRTIPLIKTLSGPPMQAAGSQLLLDKLSPRFPLRQAAVFGANALFLDTAGSISVVNQENGILSFSYSAAGSVDAAFLDENTIILGRSSATGNTPFMTVNVSTGETVPLAYPALAAVQVYRGLSGTVYGAVVEQKAENIQTSIIKLDTSNPGRSEKLIEYYGEDSSPAMAEAGGNLASTLGGGGATLYRNSGRGSAEIVLMERSSGLPVKILNGNRWFIVLDGEGGIIWHDRRTGAVQAVFRLYSESPARQTTAGRNSRPGLWVLETGATTISGKTDWK